VVESPPHDELFSGVVRRTLSTLVTLFGVSIIIFVVLRLLPGNAVTAAMGVSEGLLTKAQVAALDRYYGVGQPVIQQYWSWLHSLLQGNLGISLASREPVSTLIGTALPVTPGTGALRHGDRHRDWGGLWRLERIAPRAMAGRHWTRHLSHRPRNTDLHPRDGAGVFMSTKFHYFPSSLPLSASSPIPGSTFNRLFSRTGPESRYRRGHPSHHSCRRAGSVKSQLRAHRPRKRCLAPSFHLAPPVLECAGRLSPQ